MEFKPLTRKDDLEPRYQELKKWAREKFSFEELLHEFASVRIEADILATLDAEHTRFLSVIFPLHDEITRLRMLERLATKNETYGTFKKIAVGSRNKGLQVGAEVMATAIKIEAQKRGKKAADFRHGKPGGSREKTEEMRQLWASGKYSSRDICAEQECGAQGMSYSAARKALRNTPEVT